MKRRERVARLCHVHCTLAFSLNRERRSDDLKVLFANGKYHLAIFIYIYISMQKLISLA